jgi:hypothetical protein
MEIVNEFKEIYAVEREAKAAGMAGNELVALRQSRAKPVFERLKEKAEALRGAGLTNNALARAVTYFLRNYDRLTFYLSHAQAEVSTAAIERLLRRVAMVRKASLFVGSFESGEALAVNLSVMATCELCDIDAYAYLCDVLPKLASTSFPNRKIHELMPAAWAQVHGTRSNPKPAAAAAA